MSLYTDLDELNALDKFEILKFHLGVEYKTFTSFIHQGEVQNLERYRKMRFITILRSLRKSFEKDGWLCYDWDLDSLLVRESLATFFNNMLDDKDGASIYYHLNGAPEAFDEIEERLSKNNPHKLKAGVNDNKSWTRAALFHDFYNAKVGEERHIAFTELMFYFDGKFPGKEIEFEDGEDAVLTWMNCVSRKEWAEGSF